MMNKKPYSDRRWTDIPKPFPADNPNNKEKESPETKAAFDELRKEIERLKKQNQK